ncbi:hypothetical protein GCM10022227_42490 [Streptomyces sedi]
MLRLLLKELVIGLFGTGVCLPGGANLVPIAGHDASRCWCCSSAPHLSGPLRARTGRMSQAPPRGTGAGRCSTFHASRAAPTLTLIVPVQLP